MYIALFAGSGLLAQQPYNLQSCLNYALENNHNIRKSQYDIEKSGQARREIVGSLLPQVSGSGSLSNNLKKSKFIMPNFINEALPPSQQDPDAPKYMTIEMGTNYSAAIGATLNQQIINFSLFNAVEIAKTAENLTSLAAESKEEDVISQTASIFYAVQVTSYALGLFDTSLQILDKMIKTMEVNYSNGLVKKIDLDRIKVTRTNIFTQKSSIQNVLEVQKNLLKLQMGKDMNDKIDVEAIDLKIFEDQSQISTNLNFDLNLLTPYKLLQQQENIGKLQRKSAIYESLPVLSAMINYNYNGVSDEFFKGATNYWYGSSAVGLNLRIPIFSGLSRSAKVKQADFEILKIKEDAATLEQTLNMSFLNAQMKIEDSRKTIYAQRENMSLAEEVYNVSESNYSQGLASMSDVLNANSSLIQSQMSYADALNNFMKSYVELLKANGTVRKLIETNKQLIETNK